MNLIAVTGPTPMMVRKRRHSSLLATSFTTRSCSFRYRRHNAARGESIALHQLLRQQITGLRLALRRPRVDAPALPALLAQVPTSKYCDHTPLYLAANILPGRRRVGGACGRLEALHEWLARTSLRPTICSPTSSRLWRLSELWRTKTGRP
jgi:hypothetical protein